MFIYYIILYYHMQAYTSTVKAYEDVKEIISKGEQRGWTKKEMYNAARKHCMETYGFGERKVMSLFKTYYGDDFGVNANNV